MLAQTKNCEIDWEKCYQQLYKQVRRLVNQMKLPRWQGEEEDVIWDVVQDSMRKILEYSRRAEQGEEKPVQEIESLLYITALNCLRDRRRREKRLYPETAYAPANSADPRSHLSDVATENVYQEGLFYLMAQKIAHFPKKQRSALLSDLASRMAFDEKPTTLQAAFQAEGIWLEEYRYCQPGDEKERSRHAALLYQANQRLKELKDKKDKDIQTYLEEEHTEMCLA
jgi:DNA-directed RNA polymerase specialized sigma24 family protein